MSMKKQQITKKNKGQLSKTSAKQKTKDFMREHSLYNPDTVLENFARDMDANAGNEMTTKLYEQYQEVATLLGLETHLPVADAFPTEYRSFLVNITREIEKEYQCKGSIEKSLAETVALSHVRIILLTKAFNDYTLAGIEISKEKTDYYNLIGKELDRAHRQLSNAVLTLKQLKAPNVPFKVTAKTAFFAQNQQINNKT